MYILIHLDVRLEIRGVCHKLYIQFKWNILVSVIFFYILFFMILSLLWNTC